MPGNVTGRPPIGDAGAGTRFLLGFGGGIVATVLALTLAMLVWAPLGRPVSPPMLLTAAGFLTLLGPFAAGARTGGVTRARVAGVVCGVVVASFVALVVAVWALLQVLAEDA